MEYKKLKQLLTQIKKRFPNTQKRLDAIEQSNAEQEQLKSDLADLTKKKRKPKNE